MLKHAYLLMFGPKSISNFQSLDVVVRGSETQLQVGENLNGLMQMSVFTARNEQQRQTTVNAYSKCKHLLLFSFKCFPVRHELLNQCC